MPAVKVKENEPFDVALRRFKRSSTKSRLPSVSVKQQPLLSVTPRKCSASSAAAFACT